MACVTLKDVAADKLISAYAAQLKRQGKIKVPAWVDLVKTSTAKELAPMDEDWYYIRCAAIARQLYVKSGRGIGALRRTYGGLKPNGNAPSHFHRASGSVIRKAMQSLEQIGVLEKCQNGGRRVTATGRKDLDRIALNVYGTTNDEE